MYKVVIADDEYMVKLGIRSLIEREAEGFSIVGEAENGEEALQLILEHDPDLLITDIRMPIMDGIELIREMRHKMCRTDTVVVSGYSEFNYAQEAMRYGAVDYLLKPLETDGVMQMLNRLLVKWGASRRLPNQNQAENVAGRDCQTSVFGIQVPSDTDRSYWGYKHIVTESLTFIDERFSDSSFSLKDVALEFHLSPAYFSYMFKKVVGIPFIQYLTRLRMERAKTMLSDPGNKIYAIGYAVGYPEYSHFTKRFKKYAGLTPTEFRQKFAPFY